MNMKKTKYMTSGGQKEDLKLQNEKTTEVCNEYVYLGVKRVNEDARKKLNIEYFKESK